MDNNLFTTSSADAADRSEDCKQGQKIHCKIATRQDTLPILSLVLMVFVLLAFVTFPPLCHFSILWHGVLLQELQCSKMLYG